MTLPTSIPAATNLLAQLANPAIRALILSVIVGLGLAAFRVRTTSLRLFTWTAVLYAAVAMPLLQWMLPPLPIHAPAFLQSELRQLQTTRNEAAQSEAAQAEAAQHLRATSSDKVPISSIETHNPSRPSLADLRVRARMEAPSSTPTATASWSTIPWTAVAICIYFAVALILLVRFFVGLAFGHRLKQASQTIDDSRLASKLTFRARGAGLNFTPRAFESEFISVPLTLGAVESSILLPCDWREWDGSKLDAVLAHEVSHVARRDPFTQRVSLLHRAIFWFSPLAWWLDRHLTDLAEQASDEAVLSCGADRKDYATTLLGFFAALQTAPGRVWWQGVAMAKAGQAEKRLERILSWKGTVTMRMKKSIAAVVLALAVPLIYLAASARPAIAHRQSGEPVKAQSPASAQPAAPIGPASSSEPTAKPDPAIAPSSNDETTTDGATISGQVSGEPAPPAAPAPRVGTSVVVPVMPVAILPVAPVAPVAAIRPVAAVAPVAPVAAMWQSGPSDSTSSGRSFSYHYGYDDEQRFVIVSGKTDSFTMSGSVDDARHVEKLRKNIQGDFIWFQRDEKSYVIRDQATIDRAKKLWAPQEDLGRKQEELGKKQEVLGKQQEELGAKMEQVKVNVPDMTADLEKLKAELKQLSSGATVDQVGHLQSEIGELQSKIGDLQSHAGDQQSKLGEQMSVLGEQQGKLGEQQGELGRQQGELAREASRQMKQLLDDAITKGTAQLEM
jgi:beta-lactamase regulating signal transducer with metallopeptidase domain